MVWWLALPFLKKNKRLKLGFNKRITCFHLSKADLWIQAASAGEAYLAVAILKKMAPKSRLKVLITSTTSQGIDILETRLSCDLLNPLIDLKIEWFPFDSPKTVKNAVKAINPSVMVLLETEIWPALLYYLKKNHTRIFIINARISKKSFSNYMKTRFIWKHLEPDFIIATSDLDAQRYEQVFEHSMVNTMLNIKFESFEIDVPDSNTFKQIKNILPQNIPLTILASVRKQEEREVILILKQILKDFPDQVVALFPRHMHRISAWKKHLTSNNLSFSLRSKINHSLKGPGIILWDTFGELKTAYEFASIVFVGGSLKPLGGQNFIEPAIKGAATVTGPYYDDFAWVKDDIFKKGIVLKKDNWKTIADTIIETLGHPARRSDQKAITQKYIHANLGGTKQACNEILKAFDGYT